MKKMLMALAVVCAGLLWSTAPSDAAIALAGPATGTITYGTALGVVPTTMGSALNFTATVAIEDTATPGVPVLDTWDCTFNGSATESLEVGLLTLANGFCTTVSSGTPVCDINYVRVGGVMVVRGWCGFGPHQPLINTAFAWTPDVTALTSIRQVPIAGVASMAGP